MKKLASGKRSSLFVHSISNKDLTYGKIRFNQIFIKQVLSEGRLLAYYCLKKPAGVKHSSLFVQNNKVQTFKSVGQSLFNITMFHFPQDNHEKCLQATDTLAYLSRL
jgi:hypothetical protein